MRSRVAALPKTAVTGLPLLPGVFNDPVDRDGPGLIVPVTAPGPPIDAQPGRLLVRAVPSEQPWHAVVVWFDASELQARLIAPIVERQFGDPGVSDFNISIASKSDRRAIFQSGASVDPARADFTSDLFALRLNDLVWTRAVSPAGAGEPVPGRVVKDQVAITIVRRDGTAADPGVPHVVQQGAAWTLAVQAKRGSLEAVVARSRMRNLVLSLGVLGVLGAGLALLLVAAAREQRIAHQQLEVVASVSHELRTPLAVIRSAAENLADGVVGGENVREYGALIATEGRRLSGMVERVMDFAGISAGTLISSRRDVHVPEVVNDAVAAVASEARDRRIVIDVRCPAALPAVSGDADALRTVLQNAIGNAVKYSHPDGRVEVDVAPGKHDVIVTLADRGIGIDPPDLPHVFKPFFRGRRAVESQVRGSGVGLSVVQKIVDTHAGRVRIANRDGGGTVLTIALPIAAPAVEQA